MAECLKRSEDEKTTGDDGIVESPDSLRLSVKASSSTNTDVEQKSKRKNEIQIKGNADNAGGPEPKTLECPICLGPAVLPMKIPCGHVFCFLCIKGTRQKMYECPMCHEVVTTDLKQNPFLPNGRILGDQVVLVYDDGNQWFYESKTGGWWQYEKRTSEEIEQNYQLNNKVFDVLICGTLYTIDLNRSAQFDSKNPTKKRKIIRENAVNLLVKGIAGVY